MNTIWTTTLTPDGTDPRNVTGMVNNAHKRKGGIMRMFPDMPGHHHDARNRMRILHSITPDPSIIVTSEAKPDTDNAPTGWTATPAERMTIDHPAGTIITFTATVNPAVNINGKRHVRTGGDLTAWINSALIRAGLRPVTRTNIELPAKITGTKPGGRKIVHTTHMISGTAELIDPSALADTLLNGLPGKGRSHGCGLLHINLEALSDAA